MVLAFKKDLTGHSAKWQRRGEGCRKGNLVKAGGAATSQWRTRVGLDRPLSTKGNMVQWVEQRVEWYGSQPSSKASSSRLVVGGAILFDGVRTVETETT